MNLIERIRRYFYQRSLNSQLNSRNFNRQITNLTDAKTIGIVYDSTNPDNDIIITKFAEGLRQQGKAVEIIGFVNDKKIDHKADIVIFNPKNISLFYIPQDGRVEIFIDKKFDLLLGMFTTENLPLEYIAALSNARWRVGAYQEKKTACFDLMVNTAGKTDLGYLSEQMIFFLNKLKYDNH